MPHRTKKIAKGVALLLVFVVLQVYVSANLLASKSTRDANSSSTAAQQSPTGRLTTRGDNPVTVNGNNARSGDTVFSGQQLQTPEGTGATVQLAGLGRIDLAPNTSVMLTFAAGKITVSLLSGCVVLTANKGTVGTVESGGTELGHTDPAKNSSSVDVCTSKTPGAAPIVGQGAATAAGAGAATGATTGAATTAATTGGLFGIGVPATVALVSTASAFTIGAIIAANHGCSGEAPRGPNPSPGTPRGGCQ